MVRIKCVNMCNTCIVRKEVVLKDFICQTVVHIQNTLTVY